MPTLYRLAVVPVACAVAITAALPVYAQDAAVAEAAVRAGDSTLTCEAIIAEMNTSAATQTEAAQRAESRARAGRGFMSFARGALSAAAPMLAQGAMSGMGGMGDGMGSAVAQMALQQAQTQAMSAAMSAAQPQVDAGQSTQAAASVTQQQSPRQQHLTSLFVQRGC